jgi:hypothetical protein
MQGLILIPDISGFTNFVNNININHGVLVTKDLLNEMINSNPFDIHLSEVEGDALLYYKPGKAILPEQLFKGVRKMYNAFNRRYEVLKNKYAVRSELSLKFIVHYGNILIYDIQGFKKLFGQTVIEAHHLMKTGTHLRDYVLITDDYLRAVAATSGEVLLTDWNFNCHGSQSFNGLRDINYYFFNLSDKHPAETSMHTSDLRA